MLLNKEQLEQSEKRFTGLQDTPTRENPKDIREEAFITTVAPEVIKDNLIGTDENMVKRKQMLAKEAKEPVDFALERAIGKNDSVYSNFIELIAYAKQRVVRIECKRGNRPIGSATGFMVTDQLMLTNWHVFKTIESVGDSEVQFSYELDIKGSPRTYTSFKLAADTFFYSNMELDYCFVAVNPVDLTGKMKLSDFGWLYLDPGLGKLGNESEEALNIIHHPDGDYKQISIRENIFRKITPTSIWYTTDTAPGSSGSPVFNDQWQVVALHHMGIGRKNAAGQYIDKDGLVIPEVDGKFDETRVVWEANEGIRISVILGDIFTKYPNDALINALKIPQPAGEVNAVLPEAISQPATYPDQVSVNFPASLLEKTGTVSFNFSNNGTHAFPAQGVVAPAPANADELDFEEIKKLESELDFSACKGYQSNFLGIDIPIPEPRAALKKFLAKPGGSDGTILKYYHYSVRYHTVRMMPVISAINVDGDPAKRLDETKRVDNWLRDTRLDFDIQLSDAYYSGSGFDKGHMSRREDANWGPTAEKAKLYADLTCMYTNACPQVAAINQSKRKGLWGKLEILILENGIDKEGRKTNKISVFNGPIFETTDPVYKGIQVPLSFYKIVLWLTDAGDLKATAFVLSQKDLVGDIAFEQLDIDMEFKEYQVSIKQLQKKTQLDFSDILACDTFNGDEDQPVEINSIVELAKHIDHANR